MIPKVIHYCWFGRGKKNPLILRCMESWKRVLPEYEIVEWNEDNFDVSSTLWTKQAHEAKKWAFVSDYVRLYALYHQGGLYFDTDVEVLRPMDSFLQNELFAGFEAKDKIATAVMGAKAGNPIVLELLSYYMDLSFIDSDGSFNTLPNPYIITERFIKSGILMNGKEQEINGLHAYPQIVFSPNNFTRIWEKPSPKSFTIHHFDQSWTKDKKNTNSSLGRVRRYLIGVLRNTLGTERTYNAKANIKKRFRRK